MIARKMDLLGGIAPRRQNEAESSNPQRTTRQQVWIAWIAQVPD
jgi:hypothetical protein